MNAPPEANINVSDGRKPIPPTPNLERLSSTLPTDFLTDPEGV